MGRYTSVTVVACALLLAGCSSSSFSGSKVRPEPVSFNYPDEIVKGEGFMALADRREFAVFASQCDRFR